MTRLSISRAPLPGESLTGFMMSLAKMNGAMPLDEFEARYLYGYKRTRRSSNNYPESLSYICKRMKDEPFFPSIEEAVAMTPYYAEAAELSERKQAKMAEMLLYDIRESITPVYRDYHFTGLRFCPECQKEDIERYGSWYFHLSHNLSGVCICAKHRRPLLELPRVEKRRECLPDMNRVKEMEVPDIAKAYLHAEKMKSFLNNKDLLIEKTCPNCKEMYLTHSYSDRTGAGCPFCRHREDEQVLLQNRLNLVCPNEYRLYDVSKGLKSKVEHLPCGSVRHTVEHLLYDEPAECSDCKGWTISKVQKRVDPDKKKFIVLESYRNDNDSSRVIVKHLTCGRTFEVSKTYFMQDPSCVLCDQENRVLPYADLGVPGYTIVSEYYNNHDALRIRHDECGCVFETSKTAILAGTRCPICTNRYTFDMVSDAIKNCTSGYHVSHGKKRGKVNVYHHKECVYSDIPYYKVMNDLQLDVPVLFPDRKCRYVPPRSVRRIIYDSVLQGMKEKGFWQGTDGIDGHPITREERNLLQDLTNLGYIQRIKKGIYKIATTNNTNRD